MMAEKGEISLISLHEHFSGTQWKETQYLTPRMVKVA